ncbi:23S rRNA (pseudouridine(1915)-N(3))-methyltransferase RlmH [Chengkuizengella axinellae]|uniref:Ribosomal RNA large subunit methyltransferase H n=1 Tax=Chengkuizengella axinellae TaxID=3064388 RepID=A0ABT9J3M8_9BACL|nr:23S rRNA (pseudouridine(1915)-N(3))-methyltransferase RlmH [Chengkuizengella sp. 2205SS18-9]MDP5276047.1 23S rRNA (pseudouridine(1915)-N(3))-methyltransferase RlmH [Chengkuizengella sp. 2205SS18-9]
MQIQIVTVGKLKEKYFVQGISEYTKRLQAYAKIKIMEVPDEKAPEQLSESEGRQVKEKEGKRILAQIKPDHYVFALAINGQMWSSEQLAENIEKLATYGRSQLTFVIGGSLGLSDEVLSRADQKISFGKITYPHQLMRLILVEQVYRAFKINRGEPYHK